MSAVATGIRPDLAEALERMDAVASGLPRTDGVACFLGLHRAILDGVEDELAGVRLAAPRFREALGAAAADLVFSALEAYERDPVTAPRAWTPLFEARSYGGILPLQFALAGMNAHVNGDLPVAIVTACGELGIELQLHGAEHGDYVRIGVALAHVEAQVRRDYLSGPVGLRDRVVDRFHRVADVAAMWDLTRAREAAWANAHALWALRASPELSSRFLVGLDRMVGLGSRGLLRPV
jgi:hypothetical protein